MIASLFEHVNRGARPGDLFTIVRVDEDAAIHPFTATAFFKKPHEWQRGMVVQLMDFQPQSFSELGRVRFMVDGKVWSGKDKALRLIVED